MTDEITSTGKIELKGNGAYTAYQHSFGNLADGSIYYNPWMNINRKNLQEQYKAAQAKMQAEFKAMTSLTGGTGSTDYVLNPIYVDQQIIDISRKWTPWRLESK